MDKRFELKKSLQIGFISVFSYIACYYMRNLLGVATPLILKEGIFTKEYVGTLSSFYLLAYAIGQLINGVVGDKVKPKYMVSVGLLVSGLASILFTAINIAFFQIICFIIIGFALSMLRGPLVKLISENTLPKYAQKCCVFLSCASFIGPLIASFLAIVFKWRGIFIAAGISVMVLAVLVFVILTALEKKGIIKPIIKEKNKISLKGIFKVFYLEHFLFYMLVGALVEISAASINFWFPTYLTEKLGFLPEMSSVIFSITAIVKATTPFIALWVFKLFKLREFLMIRTVFMLSAVFFLSLIFVENKYVNIVFFVVALMFVGMASSMLWNIYIPSQGKSGMVSTVNGFLDFSGYAASFLANIVFTFAMSLVGWNGIIIMWAVLMGFGSFAAFFKKDVRFDSINE